MRILGVVVIGLIAAALGSAVFFVYSQAKDVAWGIYMVQGDKLLLSDEDVLYYDAGRHQLKLTLQGAAKWNGYIPYQSYFRVTMPNSAQWYEPQFTPRFEDEQLALIQGTPLYGKQGVVKLNGKELFRFTFTSIISDFSFSGMQVYDVGLGGDVIRFEKGISTKEDHRNDPAMIDFFRGQGKLH